MSDPVNEIMNSEEPPTIESTNTIVIEETVTEEPEPESVMNEAQQVTSVKTEKQQGAAEASRLRREAKNEENMLDDLIDFLEIDSEEFQKGIDETEKIIREDKEQKTTDKLGKNRETFNPHIELIYVL